MEDSKLLEYMSIWLQEILQILEKEITMLFYSISLLEIMELFQAVAHILEAWYMEMHTIIKIYGSLFAWSHTIQIISVFQEMDMLQEI